MEIISKIKIGGGSHCQIELGQLVAKLEDVNLAWETVFTDQPAKKVQGNGNDD